jgi:hypothetical protein
MNTEKYIQLPIPDGYTFFIMLAIAWVITVAIICLGRLDFPEHPKSWRWPNSLLFGRSGVILLIFVITYIYWVITRAA